MAVSLGTRRRGQTILPEDSNGWLYNSVVWEDLLDSTAAPIAPIDGHSFCSVPDR